MTILMSSAEQHSDPLYCTEKGLTEISILKSKVEKFLKQIKTLLKVDTAVCAFSKESHVWLSDGFELLKAVSVPNTFFASLERVHAKKEIFLMTHPHYICYQSVVTSHLCASNRLIAFPLHDSKNRCLGHIFCFDQDSEGFDLAIASIVYELCDSFIEQIELQQNHADLKEKYQQVATLNFNQTKFLQVIAHDLRAPFHGILGFSEVLADEYDSLDQASIQNISSYLNDTAKATFDLLENLLNWAMSEGGRFVYHPIYFNLKQSSQIVTSVLSSLALSKNIELIDQIPKDILVYADINMMTSVLQNLVSNALKFTAQDGTGKVIISAQRVGQEVVFLVSDTGLGMDTEQQKMIFEPKLRTTLKGTGGEKGTGLGLVLCKRFVDINHGQIKVESQKGMGTTFTVQLPAEEYILTQEDLTYIHA